MAHTIHIIGSRLSGGAERFYMRLVQGLQARGHPTLAVNRPNSMVAAELGDAVPQWHTALRNKWDLVSMLRIRRLVARRDPDIVQTYMTRATTLTRLPARARAVHVARLGGYYKLDGFRHAAAWIGNTRGICDYLVQGGLPAARVFYIANFVENPRALDAGERAALREDLALPQEALIVMGAGRVNRVKGFDILLEAFARLPAEIAGRRTVLLVLGDGCELAALQRRTAQLGLAERVRWLGWRSDPDAFYQIADLFVSSARHEPLGNVILEAWANGTPVLATRTLGAEELMRHEDSGWLVPREDPPALAAALAALLADAGRRTALARAGREQMATRYAREAIIDEYLDLYARLTRARA